FWNTATSKIVNSVKQIHAIVDGKAVVISESSVRSDLLFNDDDDIAFLTNDEIFKNLALMGYEQLSTKLSFQKAPEGEGSGIPPEPQPTPSTSQLNVSEPQTELLQTETPTTVTHDLHTEAHIEQILPSPSTYQRKQRKTQKHRRAKKVTELPQTSVPLDHGVDELIVPGTKKPCGGALAQTRSKRVLEKPNEPPLPEGHTSGNNEGSMEHTFELMDTVPPTPHDSPLTGGYTLEVMRVESSNDDLDKEDASKQGRESDKTKSMFQDSDFDVLNDDMEDVEGEIIHTATTGVSVVSAPVATAGVAIGTVEPKTPPTTVATTFIDENLTIAQTLIKMKEEKAKEKRVAIKDVEDSPRPIRSITTM
ncbi:hypothetical protein Tco_1487595, partial [Tanacetum coccineum]